MKKFSLALARSGLVFAMTFHCFASLAIAGGRKNEITAGEGACYALWKDAEPKDKPEGISCTSLTEKLMASLRLASRKDVIRAMNGDGRHLDNGGLHFISVVAEGYSGDLNVIFQDDRAVIIFASVDFASVDFASDEQHGMSYTWNAKLGECSDFPGAKRKCSTMGPVQQMMLSGATSADIDDMLKAIDAANGHAQ